MTDLRLFLHRNKGIIYLLAGILIFICVIVNALIIPLIENQSARIYTLTVTDKAFSAGSLFTKHKYFVFGEDAQGHGYMFVNRDSVLSGKYNSDDIYAELIRGNTYHLTVVGHWIPILEKYPNIIQITELVNKHGSDIDG